LIRGTASTVNQYVYAEEDAGVPARSIRSDNYKLITYLWDGKSQLFDLKRDPAEQVDVAEDKPAVRAELSGRLNEWMRENQPSREVQLRRWKIFTAGEKEIIVDEQTIGGRFLISGRGWHSDLATESGNYEMGAFWVEGGDGSKTAIWRSDDPMIGTYRVSVFYGHPSIGRLAANAPFTIVSEGGSKTVSVDFNHNAGEWKILGVVANPRYVKLSNAADGVIIADAVKFERLN
jgi:hypothetical protein